LQKISNYLGGLRQRKINNNGEQRRDNDWYIPSTTAAVGSIRVGEAYGQADIISPLREVVVRPRPE